MGTQQLGGVEVLDALLPIPILAMLNLLAWQAAG